MNENAVEFWNRVNSLIKSQKTKQQAVSESCGISYQTFRGWVTRHSFPDAQQVFRIAQALNTTVEYLLTGSQPSPKPDTAALIQTLELALRQAKDI